MRRVFLILSTVLLAILLLLSGSLLVHNAWSEAPAGFDGDSTLSTAFTYQGHSLMMATRPKANMILHSHSTHRKRGVARPDLPLRSMIWLL
jgi:hypothetical protein